MQDASKAEYVVKNVCKNVNLIMCYFNFKENVQKNWFKYEVPLKTRQKVSNDITFIYVTRSYEKYLNDNIQMS